MKRGQVFDSKGYDEVAHAAHETGRVVVLNNNSTHYLVANEDGERPTDYSVSLIKAIRYGAKEGDASAYLAYVDALHTMIAEALRMSEQEEG